MESLDVSDNIYSQRVLTINQADKTEHSVDDNSEHIADDKAEHNELWSATPFIPVLCDKTEYTGRIAIIRVFSGLPSIPVAV